MVTALLSLLTACTGRVELSSDAEIKFDGPPSGETPVSGDGGSSTVQELWSKPASQLGKVHAIVNKDDQQLIVSSDTGVHVLLVGSQGNIRCSALTGTNQFQVPVKAPATLDAAGNTIYYTRSSEKCLGAIKAQSCNAEWNIGGEEYFDCKAASDTQPALLSDGTLVLGTVADATNKAHVWGVTAASGQMAWHHELDDHDIHRSVAADASDVVYLGAQVSGVGRLYRLAAPDFMPSKILEANRIAAPPFVGGGSVIVGDWSGVLHAIDGSGGKKWELPAGQEPIFSAPVERGGTVVVAVSLNGIHATQGNKEVWSFPVTGVQFSGVAVDANNTVYIGEMEACSGGPGGCVYAVRDGKLQWRFSTDSGINATPTVGANAVYVGTQTGTIYALPLAP
ncbi:MAG: PQQ-binding-like beta-propeller repeat protein [Myxococcales bacterium]|nr:PQQ-binding-like beta-propeller repeat protein [Myxococcales bacterium]